MRAPAILSALGRRLFGCRHARAYRERRTRFGCDVLHYVCPECGHVAPIVDRSEAETRALFEDIEPKVARP